MANGFSQYQQSQLGVSAAKARAISERSQAQFRTGLTAVQEKEALERAADQLEQIAKEAEKNAAKRGRRASFGRLIGSTIGFALGGPAGKAALGTALGGLAGSAAAGGFKKYDIDVPDSLVPGGVFYGREREAFKQRADDLEEAFEDLTKSQRNAIGKNLLTDYLTGRGLGKLGKEFEPLVESGAINNVEYLKNVFNKALGLDPTEAVRNIKLETQGFKIDPETGDALDALQPRLSTDIMEQVEGLSQFTPDYIGVNQIPTPSPVPKDISMLSGGFPNAFNKQNNVLAGNTGSDVIQEVSNVTKQLSGENERPGFSGVLKGFKRQDIDFRDIFNPAGQETYFNIFPDELTDTDLLRDNNYGTNYGRYTGNRNSLFQSMVGPMGGI